MLFDKLLKKVGEGYIDVSHDLGHARLERRVKSNKGFILTNKVGGFYAFGPLSKHTGLFFTVNGRLFKTIESLRVEGKLTAIRNNFWNIELEHEKFKESFFMPIYTNTLVHEFDHPVPIELVLDMRAVDDEHEWGRNHIITVENGVLVIEYQKSRDGAQSGPQEEYKLYLAISCDKYMHYDRKEEWLKSEYDYDREIDSSPFERYVFHALKLFSKRIVFSVAATKSEAIEGAQRIVENIDKLKEMQKDYSMIGQKRLTNKSHELAYRCAVNALDGMITKAQDATAMHSSIPFNYSCIPRDEAVALRGLMLEDELALTKDILLRQLEKLGRDGTIHSRDRSLGKGYSDEAGWHFKRWLDFLDYIDEKSMRPNYLKPEEISVITRKLDEVVRAVIAFHTNEAGFAVSEPGESWMRTIDRSGATIENQMLRLCMYRLMKKLTGDGAYGLLEERLKANTITRFWDGNYLYDCVGDSTIRPNIFLALYIYPDLLSKKDWEKCVSYALKKLWDEKTGILTLPRDDRQFASKYVIEDPKTLYNGSPHLWINNIAAISLYRLNRTKYRKQIDELLMLSTRDILWKGSIGGSSEHSDADRLESRGAPLHLMAAATYAELIAELYLVHKKR